MLPDAAEEAGQPSESPRQGVRILVMDDEESVRELAGAMLQRLGYDVETVADDGQAVQIYRDALQKGRPLDVVILDLTIPGDGGKETLEKLRQLDPNVRALVSSGYSIDPIMSDLKRYGFQGVIPMPYRLEDLSRAVQAVLPGPAPVGRA